MIVSCPMFDRLGSVKRLVLCFALACLGLAGPASAQTFATFDVPGGPGTSISPQRLNAAGALTGYFTDTTNITHGFLRAADGTITTFDAPDAASEFACPPCFAGGTWAFSINLQGAIAGYYSDSAGVVHGFIRSPQGAFTVIDVPGTAASQPLSINDTGAVTGIFSTPEGATRGFARAPDGTVTTFDAPSATTYSVASAINGGGVIVGYYQPGGHRADRLQGFVRTANGQFRTVVAPEMKTTTATIINDPGAIAGAAVDAGSFLHGWTQPARGPLTVFDAPDAAGWTMPLGLNALGTIAGFFVGTDAWWHSFVRSALTEFDPPNALGSAAQTINDSGVVAGYYWDTSFSVRGYVRVP